MLKLPSVLLSLTGARRLLTIGTALMITVAVTACGSGGESVDSAASVAKEAVRVASVHATVTAFDAASATKIANENNQFVLTAAATVYWGANGTFSAVQLAAGTYTANTALLGDPLPYVVKALYVVGTDAITPFEAGNAVKLADENQGFTLTTAGTVYYGANGTYTSLALSPGAHVANNATFGDPLPGTTKAAYVLGTTSGATAIKPFDVSTATKIASEGAQFTLTAAGTVYFGANGQFNSQSLAAGTYYASTAVFGDPIPNVSKAAYVVGTTAITPFNVATATKIANEGGAFALTAPGTVYFGANGSYTSKQLTPGNYVATVSLLGDAAPAVAKTAYVADPSLVTPFNAATANKLADENGTFYLSAPALVYYGGNGSFIFKQLAAGTYIANTYLFGDPAPGNAKAAYVVGTASIPTFDAATSNVVASENTQFTLTYPTVVFFGASNAFKALLLQPGTYTASTSQFGDPLPGYAKAAYVSSNLDLGPKASAAPTITVQPQSVSVVGGQAATFTVAMTSDTNIDYQWSRNGAAIVNATAPTFTLPATLPSDSGARFTVAVTNNAGTTVSAAAFLTVNAGTTQTASPTRPFNDQSPWNSRPTQVTLGTFQIPSSYYYPTVAEGSFSAGSFVGTSTDPAVSVIGPSDGTDLYVADAESFVPQITIPHWPSNVVAPTGGDGHADIVDVAANKIHSFYQLKKVGNQWRATQYTWTALDGRGFATPGQYLQGSRATGVVPMAGMIRTFELTDGLPAYKHALAMSLSTTGLSANPTYTFPATSADAYAASLNTGSIPEGALMMLPANFDLSKIKDARLLKIVRTLQSYGAYAVDGNTGTPFVIYVEYGSGFQLMPNGGWDSEIAAELDLIRSSLRQAVTTSGWVDANGVAFTPQTNLNMMSMRGSWYVLQGSTAGVFDTWNQAVTFPDNGQRTVQINATGRSIPSSLWGGPVAGKQYRLQVTASGGATLQLSLVDGSGQAQHASGALGDGTIHVFTWPTIGVAPYVTVSSGATGGGTVTATLLAQ